MHKIFYYNSTNTCYRQKIGQNITKDIKSLPLQECLGIKHGTSWLKDECISVLAKRGAACQVYNMKKIYM